MTNLELTKELIAGIKTQRAVLKKLIADENFIDARAAMDRVLSLESSLVSAAASLIEEIDKKVA